MAKASVYSSFEVREGFGPSEVGRLDLVTEVRAEADARFEQRWAEGASVQLFGIRSEDGGRSSRVLLRSLVGLKAA